MRPRFGWRTLLSVGAALSLLAAACGDDGAAPPPAGDGDGAAQDLAGERVEAVAVWGDVEQQRFEAVLQRFEENTGADVTYISTGGQGIDTVVGTRIEGGNPPDVAILPNPGLLVDFAEQGALQPLDDVAGPVVDENYATVWRELATVDGTLYGVWFKAANKSTVWYNVNTFSDAGVEPAADWDALQSTAQTISDFGVTPISVGGADGWTLTDWFENVYLRTAGPEMYDQLANHEIPWTDQSVVDALNTLAEILGNTDWIAGGSSGALQTGFVDSVTQVYTDPPQAAIVYEGDFVAGVITGETEAQLGADADFFDFPSIDGSPPAVVGGGDVAVLLRDSPGGRGLIEFLATPEAAEVWAAEGGFTSPNQNVDPAVYPDDITRRSAEALVAAETFRFDLSDLQPAEFGGTAGQGLFGLLQEWLRDTGNVEGITQQLEDQAARAFG